MTDDDCGPSSRVSNAMGRWGTGAARNATMGMIWGLHSPPCPGCWRGCVGIALANYRGMNLHLAAATDVGRRNSNQDAFLIDEQLGLAAVSDGMGGYEGGEIASRITIETVHELIARTAADSDCTWPYRADLSRSSDENELAMAARLAGDRVARQRHGRLAKMGATLAVARVRGRRATIAHVGDSRVYRVRGGIATALTRDHSAYEEMIGANPAAMPRHQFPFGNMITKAIGFPSSPPEVCQVEVESRDCLVVCSDGLWDPVADSLIAHICSTQPLQQACQTLIDKALEYGGTDNITVAVIAIR
jgi:PPM family protein phosphatase